MKCLIKDTYVYNELSLPSRERGLKWFIYAAKITGEVVAPFAGAWIEIVLYSVGYCCSDVAPFAGAWIEIFEYVQAIADHLSLPSRERGLKFQTFICLNLVICRSLRGSVD